MTGPCCEVGMTCPECLADIVFTSGCMALMSVLLIEVGITCPGRLAQIAFKIEFKVRKKKDV